MTVRSKFTDDDKVLLISIDGDFDFKLLHQFRTVYSSISDTSKNIVIDMMGTSTINSSALGMLLNMQRFLKKPDREITIINCNDGVRKVFEITRFDKKFNIA